MLAIEEFMNNNKHTTTPNFVLAEGHIFTQAIIIT